MWRFRFRIRHVFPVICLFFVASNLNNILSVSRAWDENKHRVEDEDARGGHSKATEVTGRIPGQRNEMKLRSAAKQVPPPPPRPFSLDEYPLNPFSGRTSLSFGSWSAKGGWRVAIDLESCVDAKCVQASDEGIPLIIKMSTPRALSHTAAETKIVKEMVRASKQKKLSLDHIELPLCSFDVGLDEFVGSPAFTKLREDLKEMLLPDKGKGKKLIFEIYRKTESAPASFGSYERFRTFLESLLKAVSTVNALGLAHFDIKRFNIRMAAKGTAILCDFGSAVKTSARGDGINSYNAGHHTRILPPEANLRHWNKRTFRPSEIDLFSVGVLVVDYLYYPCTLMSAYPFGRGDRAWQNADFARRVFDMFGRVRLSDGTDVNGLFVHQRLFDKLGIKRGEAVVGKTQWEPVKEVEKQLRLKEDNNKACIVGDSKGDKFDLKVDERVFRAIFDLVLRLLEPEPQLRWTAKEALQHEFFKMELGGREARKRSGLAKKPANRQ
mmetsp:Transcript_3097/g.6241  ORF Transcript_3097/g.6241 Transcript_3097/m.6241 type:complete len:496 (+) Transcript_3097:61-1548(+)